eukprot:3679738-Amphidinium_carterae.1
MQALLRGRQDSALLLAPQISTQAKAMPHDSCPLQSAAAACVQLPLHKLEQDTSTPNRLAYLTGFATKQHLSASLYFFHSRCLQRAYCPLQTPGRTLHARVFGTAKPQCKTHARAGLQ